MSGTRSSIKQNRKFSDDTFFLDHAIAAIRKNASSDDIFDACTSILDEADNSLPTPNYSPRCQVVNSIIERLFSDFEIGGHIPNKRILEWFEYSNNRQVWNTLLSFIFTEPTTFTHHAIWDFGKMLFLAADDPVSHNHRMEILLNDLYVPRDATVELRQTLYNRMHKESWQKALWWWANEKGFFYRIPCNFLLEWPDRDAAFEALWGETKNRLKDSGMLGTWSYEEDGILHIFGSVREKLFSLLLGTELKIIDSWDRHVTQPCNSLTTLLSAANREMRDIENESLDWFLDYGLCVSFLAILDLKDKYHCSNIQQVQQTSRNLLQWCRLRAKAKKPICMEMAFAVDKSFWSFIRGEDPSKFLLDCINTIRFLPEPCVAANLAPDVSRSFWATVADVGLERLNKTRPHEKRERYSRDLRALWAAKLYDLLKINTEVNPVWRVCYLEVFLALKLFDDGNHSRIGFFKQLARGKLPIDEQELVIKIIEQAERIVAKEDRIASYPLVLRSYWLYLRAHALEHGVDVDINSSEKWLQSLTG